MGFRSDVRQFFGALLGLVRPAGPWCFPVREGGVFVGTAAPLQQQTTKVAQIILLYPFLWVSEATLESFLVRFSA